MMGPPLAKRLNSNPGMRERAWTNVPPATPGTTGPEPTGEFEKFEGHKFASGTPRRFIASLARVSPVPKRDCNSNA